MTIQFDEIPSIIQLPNVYTEIASAVRPGERSPQIKVALLTPTGNKYFRTWDDSHGVIGAPTTWQALLSEDSSFVYAYGMADFTFDAPPISANDLIVSVEVGAMVGAVFATGNRTFNLFVESRSSNAWASPLLQPSVSSEFNNIAWERHSWVWQQNPQTGALWTPADLPRFSFGCISQGDACFNQIWALITYVEF